MKIRMLTGLSGPNICLVNGDVPKDGALSDKESQALVDAGFAELVDDQAKTATKAKG